MIGESGLIGSKLVAMLRDRDVDVVGASLDTGVNTLTGHGLAAALDGASVVVDVSNSPSLEGEAAMDFFERSTTNLLDAETPAGVGHHVVLSVVGTEGLVGSGYFRGKLAQERLVAASSIPYSIVHATQFFEFLRGIADGATEGGTVRLPPVLVRPMAADDAAAAVCDTAVGEPVNGVVEFAGPEQFRLDQVVQQRLRAGDDAREVVADPQARYFGAEVHEQSLVPGDDATLAATRLEDWLRHNAVPTPS